MPTTDEMFPSKWLKGTTPPSDVPLAGVAVTIRSVALETLVDGEKWVLYFDEMKKGLVLNVTNGRSVAKLHGKDTAGWVGKKILVYQTTVSFKGEEVDALRVRSADAQAEPQAALPLA